MHNSWCITYVLFDLSLRKFIIIIFEPSSSKNLRISKTQWLDPLGNSEPWDSTTCIVILDPVLNFHIALGAIKQYWGKIIKKNIERYRSEEGRVLPLYHLYFSLFRLVTPKKLSPTETSVFEAKI